MKIRLVLLDQDTNYLEKIMNRFQIDYPGKVEVSSFRSPEGFYQYAGNNAVNVILVDENMDINPAKLPEKAAFAYLTAMAGVQELNGKKAICKFQKADVIYRELLSLYSDNAPEFILSDEDETAKIYLFASPKGGCGNTTVAAGCAAELARDGKKAVYVNLEAFGSSGQFFKGEGNGSLSDIIFTIKSKKSNLALKLESTVKTDTQTKVDFFEACGSAYDMLELTAEEKIRIITELAGRNYDAVFVDYDCQVSSEMLDILRHCHRWFVVCDGTESGRDKTDRLIRTIKVIESRQETAITDSMRLIYNRFDEMKDRRLSLPDIREAGAIPVLSGGSVKSQIPEIAMLGLMERA